MAYRLKSACIISRLKGKDCRFLVSVSSRNIHCIPSFAVQQVIQLISSTGCLTAVVVSGLLSYQIRGDKMQLEP